MNTMDLCEFALDLEWAELDERTRAATSVTTGNALALMVGAARHEAVEAAVSALRTLGGPAPVPLLGRGDGLAPMWAALVHGVAGHVEDFDDTHPPTIVHPGPPVVAAALSAALTTGASGTELLTAVAAGVEVALRVGNALVPSALDSGWHLTGIACPVGAAVAAGRLLGLDAGQLRSAVGLAATQSAGVLEALGSMAKPLHPGKAAAAGYEAAVLAAHGLDGPAAPIEGRRGLLALHAGTTAGAQSIVDGLGERWEIERNEIKPYACGVVSHSIIDVAAAAGFARRSELPAAVRLEVNPFVLVAMGRLAPKSSLEAKFSATHCFAVGYLFGQAGPAQFADEVVRAPEVVALRERCELVADESVPRYGVRAEITEADGQVRRERRDRPARLDADGVRRKAVELVTPVLSSRGARFVELAFDPRGPVLELVAAGRPAARSGPAHQDPNAGLAGSQGIREPGHGRSTDTGSTARGTETHESGTEDPQVAGSQTTHQPRHTQTGPAGREQGAREPGTEDPQVAGSRRTHQPQTGPAGREQGAREPGGGDSRGSAFGA